MNHNDLTPQNELIRRNEALAMLGLTMRQYHVDWLERHWQGELAWNKTGAVKATRGYSPALIESLKNHPEINDIRKKK